MNAYQTALTISQNPSKEKIKATMLRANTKLHTKRIIMTLHTSFLPTTFMMNIKNNAQKFLIQIHATIYIQFKNFKLIMMKWDEMLE